MAEDAKSVTLPTGTKVTGPARIVDAMLRRAGGRVEEKKAPARKSAARKSDK